MTDEQLPSSIGAVGQLGIDIGLSSIKLVCFSQDGSQIGVRKPLSYHSFETSQFDDCLIVIRQLAQAQQPAYGPQPGKFTVFGTGSGVPEFWNKIRDSPGVYLQLEDEFHCLARGVEFLVAKIPGEVFTYDENTSWNPVSHSGGIYPYLLVNIGSGVSFIKVSHNGVFHRVGGTSLGGATVCGLLSLLTTRRTFDDMVDLAEQGDNSKVDKLVGDIYDMDYSGIGFKKTAIASSFGKVFSMRHNVESKRNDNTDAQENDREAIPNGPASSARYAPLEADICRSLVFAVFNNIGQLANLHSELHSITNIYFGGSYIQGHHQTIQTLHSSVEFYARGQKRAFFLPRADSLGALGAFLTAQGFFE